MLRMETEVCGAGTLPCPPSAQTWSWTVKSHAILICTHLTINLAAHYFFSFLFQGQFVHQSVFPTLPRCLWSAVLFFHPVCINSGCLCLERSLPSGICDPLIPVTSWLAALHPVVRTQAGKHPGLRKEAGEQEPSCWVRLSPEGQGRTPHTHTLRRWFRDQWWTRWNPWPHEASIPERELTINEQTHE